MKDIFIQLLNMSIVASWLIVAVILFRFLFKKAPKWIVGMLWCMVGFRLLCPISFHSRFSLVPSQKTIVVEGNSVVVDSGISGVDDTLNAYLQQASHETETVVVSNSERLLTSSTATILLYVWVAGICVLVFGSMLSYLRLKHRLKDATRYEDNIFQTEKVDSPFVFGILRPVIYIPYKLQAEQLECVIMHEQAHIKRKDYLIKPIGYILFAIYWFNPLVWIAYIMLCRDIELACDEKVINKLGYDKKKIYSQTLLECSIPQSMLLACPVAFAEVGVKERIVNIMRLKKAKKGIIIGAFAAVVVVTFGFMTNPLAASKELEEATIEEATIEEATIEEATIEEATIEEATIEEATIEEATIEEATIEEAIIEEATIEEPTVSQAEETPVATSISLLTPVVGGVVTSRFSREHQAVDFAAPEGTPLLAAFSGTVSAVGFNSDNGNYFVITNEQGWSIYYNHCQDILVTQGQTVSAGSTVGTIGTTGKSTGPHVHFALSAQDGSFVDPGQYGLVY